MSTIDTSPSNGRGSKAVTKTVTGTTRKPIAMSECRTRHPARGRIPTKARHDQ